MTSDRVYLTEIKQKTLLNKMQVYVQNFDSKIDRAKWKQNLILTYNYMPLQIAKDKIQSQRQLFSKKLQVIEQQMVKQTQNDKIQQQVELFRDFSMKLSNKMKQVEQQINLLQMQMQVLRGAVFDKKQNLMDMLKQNVDLHKKIIQYAQQHKNHQKKRQSESKEIKIKEKVYRTQLKQVDRSYRSKTMYESIKSNSRAVLKNYYSTQQTYIQCVESLVKCLKKMSASQDVQAGIYLQIMNRKIENRAATFSLKSQACNTLMDRYKDLKKNKIKEPQDFSMSLQTFIGLNWKQIMGIILVKDRNADKLKSLLRL